MRTAFHHLPMLRCLGFLALYPQKLVAVPLGTIPTLGPASVHSPCAHSVPRPPPSWTSWDGAGYGVTPQPHPRGPSPSQKCSGLAEELWGDPYPKRLSADPQNHLQAAGKHCVLQMGTLRLKELTALPSQQLAKQPEPRLQGTPTGCPAQPAAAPGRGAALHSRFPQPSPA